MIGSSLMGMKAFTLSPTLRYTAGPIASYSSSNASMFTSDASTIALIWCTGIGLEGIWRSATPRITVPNPNAVNGMLSSARYE